MFTFTIDMDAAGNADQVILPVDAPGGCRKLTIVPPVGHAWTYAAPTVASPAAAISMDQQKEFHRTDKQAPYQPGESLPLFVALDTGSGTGYGTLE